MTKANQAITVSQDEISQKAVALKAEAQERAAALQELGVGAADLVIPSIQVMQNTSQLVGDGRAKLGDVVNMATEQVLGGADKPVKVLPLKLFKTMRVYAVKPAFKFLREEELTPQNDKQGEGVENGVPVKYYPTMNFFVLLKSELEKGEGFPCLLRFKSTGTNAGRTLATHLYKLVCFRKRPYSLFVELSTRKEKKETNTFAIPVVDVSKSEKASATDLQAAETWLAMLAAGNYKIDEREDSVGDGGSPAYEGAKPVVVGSEVVGIPDGEY